MNIKIGTPKKLNQFPSKGPDKYTISLTTVVEKVRQNIGGGGGRDRNCIMQLKVLVEFNQAAPFFKILLESSLAIMFLPGIHRNRHLLLNYIIVK